MDNVFEFAKENKVYIEHPIGGERNIAGLYEIGNSDDKYAYEGKGLGFVDVFWDNNSSIPVHFIYGNIEKSLSEPDTWLVIFLGSPYIAYIRKLTEDKKELWAERQRWDAYCQELGITDEQTEQVFNQFLKDEKK